MSDNKERLFHWRITLPRNERIVEGVRGGEREARRVGCESGKRIVAADDEEENDGLFSVCGFRLFLSA